MELREGFGGELVGRKHFRRLACICKEKKE